MFMGGKGHRRMMLGGRPPLSDHGFSLIEVVVAMAVLAVCLPPASLAIISTVSSVSQAKYLKVAVGLADSQLQAARQLPPSSLSSYNPCPTGNTLAACNPTVNGKSYAIVTAIHAATALATGAAAEWLQVSVTWPTANGLTGSVVDEEELCTASCLGLVRMK